MMRFARFFLLFLLHKPLAVASSTLSFIISVARAFGPFTMIFIGLAFVQPWEFVCELLAPMLLTYAPLSLRASVKGAPAAIVVASNILGWSLCMLLLAICFRALNIELGWLAFPITILEIVLLAQVILASESSVVQELWERVWDLLEL
ncbi:hypothetical protein F5Y01DRAFT_212267 [Xylaria sp. FL0043]|nr:hypothetical protein F5Y01DRAFT_212267 [Xylaria sp. FL0043]